MRLCKLAPLGLAVVLLLSGCGGSSSVISVTSVEVSGSTASVSEPDYSVIETSSQEVSSSQSLPEQQTVLPGQLKLDAQKIYLAEGQTRFIDSVVYPANALGKQLVWSSTDSSVASVKDGVVKFVSPGSAVITASTLLGDLTESCQVECVAVCDTAEKLESVLKTALLSGESVFNTYLYDTILLDEITVDPVYGLYTATVKEKIYFVGDETMSEVYPVSFALTPNFASGCLKALAAGSITGLSLLQNQACASAKKFAENQFSAELSDYQKVKIIHDFIVKNGNLDAAAAADAAYSETVAYGVLIGDIAVSDGYADAFKLLAGLAGIEARTIVGTVGEQRRVWNLVKLNDSWYHIDIVADDRADLTDGTLNYDFFLISDARIAVTHSWNKAESLSAPNDYIEK